MCLCAIFGYFFFVIYDSTRKIIIYISIHHTSILNSSIIHTPVFFLFLLSSVRYGCVINILMFDAHVTNPHTQKDLLHSNRSSIFFRRVPKEAIRASFHTLFYDPKSHSIHAMNKESFDNNNLNNNDDDIDIDTDQKEIIA